MPAGIEALVADQLNLGQAPLGDNVPGFNDDIGTYITFLDPGTVDINYVLCYRIGANSCYENITPTSTDTIPFEGNLFVYCQGAFTTSSLTDEPQFPVFLESIEPDVTALDFHFEFDSVAIRFTDAGSFLTGYGEHCVQDMIPKMDCDTSRLDGSLNNMISDPLPLIYNLGGCAGSGADFHLPGVQYASNGAGELIFGFVDSFDFDDPNFRLVFDHYSYCDEDGYLAAQTFEIPLFRTGDTNLDGEVNLLDVAPLVNCITSGTYQFQCDLDQNQVVDLLDIEPFVELLVGG